MTRLYGREISGQRVYEYAPDVRFERTSIISSIRLNGDTVPLIFKGTLTGELFKSYVKKCLAPTLKEGDIVIMDNCSAHKVKGVEEAIEARGAKILWLPPYSPDFNPIELSWSKMKSIIRKLKPRTYDDLTISIEFALNCLTKNDIQNWFIHDGYRVNT
jgi:transposase